MKENLFKTENIPLKQVDLSDRTYIFTFEPIMSQMVQSVKQIGLINPPILAQVSDQKRFRVISGLKRILALHHLHIETFPARIIPENDDKPILKHFLLNLYENISTRNLNPIEKSIVLRKLIKTFQLTPSEVASRFLPLMELGTNPMIIDKYLALEQLEDNIKIAIIEDTVSPEFAVQLLQLSADDRHAFFQLIELLKLGKNRQKEFLKLISDIAGKEQCNLSDVIHRPALQNIIHHDKLTPTQKVEKIRAELMRSRYPHLTTAEKKFQSIKKALKLSPRMVLRHSPYFEGETFSFEVSFHNQTEFESIVRKFYEINQSGYIKQLETVTD